MEGESSINEVKTVEEEKVCMDIRMIPAKITYFLIGAMWGAIYPYINVFLVSTGISITHAGYINGISCAVAAIAGPLWGMLADFTGYRKLIFILLSMGALVAFFPIPWIAYYVGITAKNTTCLHNKNTTSLWIDEFAINNNKSECVSKPYLSNPYELFSVMLTCMVFANMFSVSLRNYTGSIAMNVIKNNKRKVNFGPQRVFASISATITNFLAGIAIDHYHSATVSRYTAAFYVSLPFSLLIIPSGYYLSTQAVWVERESKSVVNTSKHFISFFRSIDNLVFLISVLISGVATLLYNNFLYLLMIENIHTSKSIMAATMTTAGIAAILIFPVTGKLIKIFGGPIPCVALGIFSYFVRFMVMSYAVTPLEMMLPQLLHGICFALSWAAQMDYTYMMAHKEVAIMLVTFIYSLHSMVGAAIANLIGGYLFHAYGGRLLFRGYGILCGVWSTFFILYFKFKVHRSKSSPEEEPPTGELSENVVGISNLSYEGQVDLNV